MKYFTLVILISFQMAIAEDNNNTIAMTNKPIGLLYEAPSKELLDEKFCPLDSTANAMVERNSVNYVVRKGVMKLQVFRRIKIYTEAGLSYAQYEELYDQNKIIDTLGAICFTPQGTQFALSEKDIIDETVIKDLGSGRYLKSKKFAIPGVTPGCVINIISKCHFIGQIEPPVFRFQEDIPVENAYYSFGFPENLKYSYIVTNENFLTRFKRFGYEISFDCIAEDIAAIEEEPNRPPDRFMSTDVWVHFTGVEVNKEVIDLSETWKEYLKPIRQSYSKAFDGSRKAKIIADSLLTLTNEHNLLIKFAINIVRDRWGNDPLYYMHSAGSDDINKIMGRENLDPVEKSLVLCAILKNLKIESEIVWACSEKCKYTPVKDFPSYIIFDHALAYIPEDSLLLDPSDPGGDVGILDEDYSDRIMCRPMATSNIISMTPKFGEFSSKMIDLTFTAIDENTFTGQGSVKFYNQDAIEARRLFRKEGEVARKKALNNMLFRDGKDIVTSLKEAPDSLLSPKIYQLDFEVKLSDFNPDENTSLDFSPYPGPSFDNTTVDYNPPRQYPFYFDYSKVWDIYNIKWSFGKFFHPIKTDSLSFKLDNILVVYSYLTDYNKENNEFTVRREYKRIQKSFRPDFATAYERFLQSSKKCDMTPLVLEKY